MIRPDFRNFIAHSAKGSEWKDHKYVRKIDGVYYYPVGYEDGRTVDSLNGGKDNEETKKTKEEMIDEVWNHFDQYLAKRGIDWRTLPKDQVDQMQRDIARQMEEGKETGTSEKTAEELAKDVIAGRLGSGDDRKRLLGDMYEEVQEIVNQILKSPSGSKKVSEVTEETRKKVEEVVKTMTTKEMAETAITLSRIGSRVTGNRLLSNALSVMYASGNRG